MSCKRLVVSMVIICCLSLPAATAEFVFGVAGTANTEAAASSVSANPLWGLGSAGFRHESGGFRLAWELGFTTEGVYPAPFLGDFYGPFAVDILEAGLSYASGPFYLAIGKLENKDVIESPYSLFVSGLDQRTMLADIRYDDGFFFFEDRWMGLNSKLMQGLYASSDQDIYDDRGAVLKNYGFRFGKLRVGFQDVIVYTGSYFDVDAFANPAPGFFVQYVATALGRPWTRTGNENSIMGFYGDYEGDGWTVQGQVLVDDLNLNRFINPSSYQNPDKIAITLGGTCDTSIGTLGFYVAGATRDTFESIDGEFYSYTYYPGSAVYSGGSYVGIPLSSNYIGYAGGENNFSSMATWEKTIGATSLNGSLEFSLTGEQSPANPWHDSEIWTDGTHWLDDPLLEKKIVLSSAASWRFGSLALTTSGRIGWVANRLELAESVDSNSDGNAEPMWKPSDSSGFIGALSLGLRYVFKP